MLLVWITAPLSITTVVSYRRILSVEVEAQRFDLILGMVAILRGDLQKKNSIFKDIIQIEVDLPPFHPIFDKNHDILGFAFTFSIILITFWGSGVQSERHRVSWLGQIEY